MHHRIGILIALLPMVCLQAPSAFAQATRTWVSGVGDDANPCSRTAPCKTFAGAITKTAASGEINVLDPGGFGTLTITKSITIVADGAIGGVLAAGTNGFNVNLPAGSTAVLQGLDIEGAGTGIAGIGMVGQGKLTVIDCTIRGFTGAGIDVKGGSGARVMIDRATIVNNAVGVRVKGAGGVANTAFLQRSVVDANVTTGVQVEDASTVVLSGNTLSGSGTTDLAPLTGGTAISYGNNLIRSGSPTQTLPLQ